MDVIPTKIVSAMYDVGNGNYTYTFLPIGYTPGSVIAKVTRGTETVASPVTINVSCSGDSTLTGGI